MPKVPRKRSKVTHRQTGSKLTVVDTDKDTGRVEVEGENGSRSWYEADAFRATFKAGAR